MADQTFFQADAVTPAWIREQMELHGKSSKDLSQDLNINHSVISVWINGGRPMSKAPKAMFYFYFDNLRIKKENGI